LQTAARCLARLGGAATLLAGCSGVQSAFSTFGVEAESTRTLTWGMVLAGVVIMIGMVWIVQHAVRAPAGRLDLESGMRVILWLGAIGPTLLLAVLLLVSLPKMGTLSTEAVDLDIAVDGEQFWWRVRYLPVGGQPVETANEIRVPVGRTVRFALASPDVIHSLWIPGLAGKVDMIPGRTNDLIVRATRAGVYRGTCAEFCGLSHARMAFDVIAMEPADFDRWLAEIARPAGATDSPGRQLFEEYGCAGCHTIRGHFAGGVIGPDLTHLGTRRSLAAGTLPMTRDAISTFIRNPAATKPGALMPGFEGMPAEHADAVADYLLEFR
jgi:cytochrome c oxidase subunit 2